MPEQMLYQGPKSLSATLTFRIGTAARQRAVLMFLRKCDSSWKKHPHEQIGTVLNTQTDPDLEPGLAFALEMLPSTCCCSETEQCGYGRTQAWGSFFTMLWIHYCLLLGQFST